MRTSREPVRGPVVEQRGRLPAVGGHAPAGPSGGPDPGPIQDGEAARGA